MIGPLVAVLLMGNFYINLIKPETCFYTSTPLENKIDKSTGTVCKPKDVKRWDEKVTNRRGRAFTQKIITPFQAVYQEIQPCS